MNIGYMGLGKLGLPVALATEAKGHSVIGYDISPRVAEIINERKLPYEEKHAQDLLETSRLKISSLSTVVAQSEIIFVPIQTPHEPAYEGTQRLPERRVDFDYSWLCSGIKDLSEEIEKQGEEKIVVIISTVLPGTIKREISPLLGAKVKLCYNPYFIAMGTTIDDYLFPEFTLLGVHDNTAARRVKEFYKTIHSAPVYETSIENAELIKVSYNTFISTKISFANTLMELSHKLPNTNVDAVTDALKLATQRIVSPAYMSGGMGDGGGCHPRDNIALSWLAREVGMSTDWFESIMLQREAHTDFLVDLIVSYRQKNEPIFILGKSFKPETNIQTGSPALLLENLLSERGITAKMFDPYIDSEALHWSPGIYFVATRHPEFASIEFPPGSVVIDPWRYVQKQENVEVVSVGG